jgi:CheY-like chemotaxis protein
VIFEASVKLDTPDLVRTIRMKAGISQEELARRMGVSFASVNAWERGRTEPRAVHRMKLDEMAKEAGVRQGLTVIIIDDEPVVCELAEAMIRSVAPEAVITIATSGTDGLLACGAVLPDLVLLDLRMPGLDGLEVADAMARRKGMEHTVLVFVTGTTGGEDRARAERVAARVVTKPLRRAEMAAIVGLVDDASTRRIGDIADQQRG